MSKKDYELIASTLKRSRHRAQELGIDAVVAVDYTITQFADDLGRTNPRFNRATFLSASDYGDKHVQRN